MFSFPPRRSSPGPHLCPHTSAERVSCQCLSRPESESHEGPHDLLRPALKRQATAPLLSSSTVLTKKRDAVMTPEDNRPHWSEDVHSTFLEALQMHPPIPTWRFNDSCKDTPDDEQAEYHKIIQDYILKKTGCPHSFEQISEQINLVLSSPLASPLVKTPAEPEFHEADTCYYHPHGEPMQTRMVVSLDTHEVGSDRMRISESPSMSRRRKACNRPTLNLHVDMPPIIHTLAPGVERSLAHNRGSAFSGLTPSTASFRPFLSSSVSEDEWNPCTPAEQCHNVPLAPPEIPRAAGRNRVKAARWIPTPTEGVLPFLSYPPATPSPLSASSISGESSSSDSALSNATECMQPRPKMSSRGMSWLSMPVRAISTHVDSSTLASPIATCTGSSEGISSSFNANCTGGSSA